MIRRWVSSLSFFSRRFSLSDFDGFLDIVLRGDLSATSSPLSFDITLPPAHLWQIERCRVDGTRTLRAAPSALEVRAEKVAEVGCRRSENEGYVRGECVGFDGIELQQPDGLSRQEYRHRQIATCVP